ncbi:MAG: kelch repeat-containing protein [Phycisphaerae bacterium]
MDRRLLAVFGALVLVGHATAAQRPPTDGKPYRLPSVDLKSRVIWGAECRRPDGSGLAFGGQDQEADDGRPHTRILENGEWVSIADDLRAANPLRRWHAQTRSLAERQAMALASARATYLDGLGRPPQGGPLLAMLAEDQRTMLAELQGLADGLHESAETHRARVGFPVVAALGRLHQAEVRMREVAEDLARSISPDGLAMMLEAQVALEQAADAVGAEPPPRALSPIVYEPKTGVYVVFGGDHFDYLMNDTWTFDPKARRWRQAHPPKPPPPRANHTLKAPGDGTVVLSGGYTYANATWYMAGQYVDLADGPWTYDVAEQSWSGPSDGAAPERRTYRTYRTGPFHPSYYLEGPPPDPARQAKVLADLPVNRWVLLEPPRIPRQNRDWGTVRLDADRDRILVWSGGHSAHGGTDVLHYHLGTNRWELPFPVAFPLGQLYANTRYPDGFTFNRRPWPTGHTYQNYAYDPISKTLLFAGRPRYTYVYDPDAADWTGRFAKPPAMVYNSCFYTLTLTATPRGVFCWGQGPERERGRIHRFDAEAKAWRPVQIEGHLPEPVVDHSTMVYDPKRDRLLALRTRYGKPPDGQVYALDLDTLRVRTLDPPNREAAAGRKYTIDRACYVPGADLMFLCTLLPAGGDGLRRHLAYDCARNRWVSLRIQYEDGERGPLAPTAVRRSVGLVWDGRRGLVWGVDTHRLRVFVLRFDAEAADVEPLR